jgi:hypothetical protein
VVELFSSSASSKVQKNHPQIPSLENIDEFHPKIVPRYITFIPRDSTGLDWEDPEGYPLKAEAPKAFS